MVKAYQFCETKVKKNSKPTSKKMDSTSSTMISVSLQKLSFPIVNWFHFALSGYLELSGENKFVNFCKSY